MKRALYAVLAVFALVVAFGVTAKAEEHCTDVAKKKWLGPEKVKSQLRNQGYKLKIFKEEGTCYEVYGWDKAGNKAELYIDPASGNVVKSK